MKKIFTLCVATLTFSAAVSAQALPSMLAGTDAAAVSMGGISAALPAGAFAIDNNSAALAQASGTFDAALSYAKWAPQSADATLAGLGAYYKLNDQIAFGLSGKLYLDRPYDIVGVTGVPAGTFAPKDIIVALGASYAINPELSLGATGRMIASSIGPEASGTAFCADIMANYVLGSVNIAAGVCNLGSKISYGADSYALPALVKAAGSWSAAGFTAGAEVDYLLSGAVMAGIGVEYGLWDIVFIRGGFHYGDQTKALPMYASAGLGLKFAGIHLDAAFLTASKTLGNTLMLSLGYAF